MRNGVMLQAFEWNVPSEGKHYDFLKNELDHLQAVGFTALWLPPACKATSVFDTGYGIYDLYDLGEFDQKGERRTKYGTKEELLALIEAIHGHDMQAYADVVLNHKASADEEETFMAEPVAEDDRNQALGEPRDIQAWTKFTFPGRAGQYSDMVWNFNHFTGVDYDSLSGTTGVFKVLGENKAWSEDVSPEKGNYDYLMFADIDHQHPEVRNELFNWATWFIKETGVDGFRFDALKHIDQGFIRDLIHHIRQVAPDDFYLFGELWLYNEMITDYYLHHTDYKTDLVDVGLHYNLYRASTDPDYDMRTIFDGSLVQKHPSLAVTFVDNHDSQPGQALESFVEPWFKKIAYGLILLRRDGYPCVFFGDYYGMGEPANLAAQREVIDNLLFIRKAYAFGEQVDYFQDEKLIGFTRMGEAEHPGRLAVVISTGSEGSLRMFVGTDQAGSLYADLTGSLAQQVTIDEEGYADFPVKGGDISCYAQKED